MIIIYDEFMNQNIIEDKELDWDCVIDVDNEPIEFKAFPAGEYRFVVKRFLRGRTKGSDRVPPSNKVELTITVFNEKGEAKDVKDNLIMRERFKWKLSEFFTSIGAKKKDENLKIDWNNVIGAKGFCVIDVEVSSKGNEYNKIVKYLEPVYLVADNSKKTNYSEF